MVIPLCIIAEVFPCCRIDLIKVPPDMGKLGCFELNSDTAFIPSLKPSRSPMRIAIYNFFSAAVRISPTARSIFFVLMFILGGLFELPLVEAKAKGGGPSGAPTDTGGGEEVKERDRITEINGST